MLNLELLKGHLRKLLTRWKPCLIDNALVLKRRQQPRRSPTESLTNVTNTCLPDQLSPWM